MCWLNSSKFSGTVVYGRGETEAEVDEGLFAADVPVEHAADLGQCHMRLVDEEEEVGGEVVDEAPGSGPAGDGEAVVGGSMAARQVARVVLDAGAVARLADHLDVKARPLFQALGLHELIAVAQPVEPLRELQLDVLDSLLHLLLAGDKVLGGVDFRCCRAGPTSRL